MMGGEDGKGGGGVPPGFRFHPTDEELLHYYLKKKLSFQKFDMEVIKEIDLNKIEPWELHERCNIGSAPQNEWYLFSHKDRKYPTGSRTNRATNAGFWKATGRDKSIRNSLKKIGMRKTLVFYRGRAPHGQKTDWIMHEYRLEDPQDHHDPNSIPELDGWVVCKAFKKKDLFKVKVGNGEAISATNSFDDQQLPLNNDHRNMYHNNQYLLHQDEDHMAHILPHHYSQFQPHNFLPLSSFHKQILPASLTSTCNDFSVLPHPIKDQCNNLNYNQAFDSELEAQTCDHPSRAGVGPTNEPNLSKWAMVDPPLLTSFQPEFGNDVDDDGHNHDDVNASPITHISLLALRGEIDLWGTGK